MELSYQDIGEGHPVVILHGLFGAAKNWNSIAKQMARKYRILTVDLRNHGASPWTDTMSYVEMAQDLVEFLDQRGLDKASIVGHSMGGKVAMTMALKSPERVERLVVADIAPVKYPRMAFKSYVEKLQSVDLSTVSRRSEVDPLISDVIESSAVRAFLLGNLQSTKDGLRWMVNLETLGREMDSIGGVPAIRMDAKYDGETLFIDGASSDYIQSSHHQLIRHLFPNVQFHSIADAGHWVHAEKPHDFMAALNDFLP
ncbi:putative hydrolase or acyltransferase [Candidatus Terasakiella magnetica]|uniref:Putative hydrolase or acyltransferase n=1 Tax=Candidatus Terasakiella magnetica TaxID=1867952 RepID=A0A1C3RC83_9PROT|nr:alpha/beta fold hydrolase [Candidatus Terasakiella magnetica]SCA54880.1 putative hydrolase or acyltransferase [Candidatus Terasakiella magnetica]